jgi:hypothetical protein
MTNVFDLSQQRFFRTLNTVMKFYVVEYSVGEDTTSIRTFQNVLRDNYKRIRNGVSKDYLPVGLFKSHDEALRCSLHFQTVVAPQAKLEAGSRKWKRIADCFEKEFDTLMTSAKLYDNSLSNSGTGAV